MAERLSAKGSNGAKRRGRPPKEAARAPSEATLEASGIAGSNSDSRAAIIQEVVRETVRLKAEKAAIQELITEQRGRIKSLGIHAIDFNVALRLYELEAEDRNQSLDAIRECCQALNIGQQVDWIEALAKVGGDPKPSPDDAPGDDPADDSEDDNEVIVEAGRQAWRDDKRLKDNPYDAGVFGHRHWENGFLEAQAAAARSMGDGKPAHA